VTLFGRNIPAFFSLLIWGGIWEIVGQLDLVFIFPPLSSVLVALVEIAQRRDFHEAALVSLKAFSIGMAFAITGGIFIGFLMGRVEAANRVLGMWVSSPSGSSPWTPMPACATFPRRSRKWASRSAPAAGNCFTKCCSGPRCRRFSRASAWASSVP
jgi:hypothetical protein